MRRKQCAKQNYAVNKKKKMFLVVGNIHLKKTSYHLIAADRKGESDRKFKSLKYNLLNFLLQEYPCCPPFVVVLRKHFFSVSPWNNPPFFLFRVRVLQVPESQGCD
jgi:hypothetical protein